MIAGMLLIALSSLSPHSFAWAQLSAPGFVASARGQVHLELPSLSPPNLTGPFRVEELQDRQEVDYRMALALDADYRRLTPALDHSCQIPPALRSARIALLGHWLGELDRDTPGHPGSIQTARHELGQLQEVRDSLESSHEASRALMAGSVAVGVTAGVFAVWEVFFSGMVVDSFLFISPRTVQAVFGYSSEMARLAAQTAVRYVTAAGGVYRAISVPMIVPFLLSSTDALGLSQIHQSQIQSLQQTPLFSPCAVEFLNSPGWDGNRCLPLQPQLEQSWTALWGWYRRTRQIPEEDPAWRWYNPATWEWHTRYGLRRLNRVELPFGENTLLLLRMKRAYLRRLRDILEFDGRVCSARARSPNGS